MIRSLIGSLAIVGLVATAQGQVVISQVYGGGGNTGSVYARDFVELHNNGTTTVDMSGWSIQYASSGGNFGGANTKVDFPPGTQIAPGAYFLIALAQGSNPTSPLPTPDLDTPLSGAGTIAMSATAGKVALVSSTTPVSPVACPTDTTIVDFVGYGAATNCFEGSGPTGVLSNSTAAIRNSNGCQDTNNNGADFQVATPNPRNSSTIIHCPGFNDCNNNGVPDNIDISSGSSQDCNTNGVPDECELSSGDCDANGQLDSCEIAANPSLDCNGNGRKDICDIRSGLLTDADANGTPDSCEGAAVAECSINATIRPDGIRPTPSGNDFFNVEGVNNGVNASYGAIRFDIPSLIARFNTDFGVGQWEVTRAYLYFQQSNAAFTLDSLPDAIEVFYSNLDSIDFTPQNTVNPALQYANFNTDWSDADMALAYTFTRGPGGSGSTAGSGTIESYSLYTLAGPNNSAQAAIGGELNAATGLLTILIKCNDNIDPFAAATYAGRTNSQWRGPSLVVWAQATGPSCDPDVNCDGSADGFDVEVMEQAVGGDMSNFCQADPDFNRDGSVDGFDVESVERVVGGSPCP
jgi:hypothetical protein